MPNPTTDHVADVELRPPDPGDSGHAASPPTSCAGGDLVCGDGIGSVTLARATATASGTLGAHGELVPLFEDELVYVMTWPRTICAGGGGMPVFAPAGSPSGAVRSRGPGAPDTTTGTAITYVDAASPGHMLFAACGPG